MAITCKSQFWHQLNTLHSGMGKLQVLYPDTSDELQECISQAKSLGKKLLIIGNGSNLVGSDEDDICIAVKLPALPELQIVGTTVSCNCGVQGTSLFWKLAELSLGGAAAISGIPGTLGGLLKMNAGANGMEICEIVAEMQGIELDSGKNWHWARKQGGWAYRQSPVPGNVCVTRATLTMQTCIPEQELNALKQESEHRKRVTPSWWSAGSIFRNPTPDIPAGRLLEEAGCKGLEQPPFQVSIQHANWIVNSQRQPGSAAAVLKLIEKMRSRCPVPLQCELVNAKLSESLASASGKGLQCQ